MEIQQFPRVSGVYHPCRFVIHDRDSDFLCCDSELKLWSPGLENAGAGSQSECILRRLVGTIRRECLLLNEGHLKRILRDRARHYNRGRLHSSLGPGIPETSYNPRPVQNDTAIASNRSRFLGDYTINIAWERRLRDADPNSCGSQGLIRRTSILVYFASAGSVVNVRAGGLRIPSTPILVAEGGSNSTVPRIFAVCE